MAIEQNKAVVRRFFEEVLNKGNLSVIDELATPDCVVHNLPPQLPANIEGYKQFIAQGRTAFPDVKFILDDMVAEGDKIAVRCTWTGTNTGPMTLMNLQPTFKKATLTGLTLTRFDDKGKAIENWQEYDGLNLLQQLGLMPAPA